MEKSDSSESIDSGFGECKESPSIIGESPSFIGEYKESPSISSNLSLKSILRQGLASSPNTDTTKKKASIDIIEYEEKQRSFKSMFLALSVTFPS